MKQNAEDVANPTEILPEEVATYTENILKSPDAFKRMESDLFLHTMDFAGQPVYSVTHPVFLPPKGIYLLVHNLENDLHSQATPIVKCGAAERKIDDYCPMTNMDHLEFWLSLVAANSTLEGASPVFVVSTHADKPLEADVKKTSRQILDTLTREHFAPGEHVVHGIYIVDNTVSGSASSEDVGVKELKSAITSIARNLPQLNEDIPIRWLHFEKKLIHLVKDEEKKYISLEEARSIALKCEVDVGGESNELTTLLNYLHDLKVIIHFPETNMVIIDTQWLLDMFAKVITVQPIECQGGFVSDWRKLEHKGIVNAKFLEHLWGDLLQDHTSANSLVSIMGNFSLICKQRDGSFLVPAMLMNTSAEEANAFIKADDMTSPLVIRFESSHLPFGLFPRLVVATEEMCNSEWPSSSQPSLSRNFARFYIVNDTFNLLFMSDVQTITVALVNEETPGLRDDSFIKLCRFILDFLKKTINEMMKSFPWMKALQFEFCVRCTICDVTACCRKHTQSECSRDSCMHFVSEKELLESTKPRCYRNPTKPNVISASTFSHWFQRTGNQLSDLKEVQNKLQALSLPLSTAEDDFCKEIIAVVNQNSASPSSNVVAQVARKIADKFTLDKHSVTTPPEVITRKCRSFCTWFIAQGGETFVQALRAELPSGMTGPLKIRHDILVQHMDTGTKETLSKALVVKESEWRRFAQEKVGLSIDEIEFLDKRVTNPVLEILNEHCGQWSVEKLYEAIVNSGADAIADRYL